MLFTLFSLFVKFYNRYDCNIFRGAENRKNVLIFLCYNMFLLQKYSKVSKGIRWHKIGLTPKNIPRLRWGYSWFRMGVCGVCKFQVPFARLGSARLVRPTPATHTNSDPNKNRTKGSELFHRCRCKNYNIFFIYSIVFLVYL